MYKTRWCVKASAHYIYISEVISSEATPQKALCRVVFFTLCFQTLKYGAPIIWIVASIVHALPSVQSLATLCRVGSDGKPLAGALEICATYAWKTRKSKMNQRALDGCGDRHYCIGEGDWWMDKWSAGCVPQACVSGSMVPGCSHMCLLWMAPRDGCSYLHLYT